MSSVKNKGNNGPPVKPVTVLFILIVFTLILFFSTDLVYWLMMAVSFAVLGFSDKRKACSWGIAFCILYASVFLMNRFIHVNQLFGAIYTMALIITKLYPLWLLSAAFVLFSTSEIMNSLRVFGLPNHICISIAIFFRFLPDYIEYFKAVKEGLLVRGIRFDIRKPGKSMEVYIVPMINKAFKTGEVITGSLLTKGIEYDCKKTSFRDIKPKFFDYIIISAAIILLGVNLWTKYFLSI